MSLPILISGLVKYFDGSHDLTYAVQYASVISVGLTVNCIIHHPQFLSSNRNAIRIRIALSGLIYKKVAFFAAWKKL
jgi:hypothetical protein